MATSDDAEYTFSHRHTESAATHERILSERILSDDSCTLGEQEKPTWKWVGKAETQACHKPHSWHSNIQLRRNPQFPVSP